MQKLLGWLIGAGLVSVSSATLAVPLISASGLDGAGLGMVPAQTGRAWGDIAWHTQDEITIVAPTLGVGFMPTQNLEVGAMLPFTRVSEDGDSESELGNITLGISYVDTDSPTRFTVGVNAALPTASDSGTSALIALVGVAPHAYQHPDLRMPGVLGLSVPLHLESGTGFVGHLDAQLSLFVDTGDTIDEEMLVGTLAPGLGGWVSPSVALGVRLPLFLNITEDVEDRAQISIEPYVRFILGSQGFLGVRFNVPMDEPLTKADMWGLHIGGGAAF